VGTDADIVMVITTATDIITDTTITTMATTMDCEALDNNLEEGKKKKAWDLSSASSNTRKSRKHFYNVYNQVFCRSVSIVLLYCM
jgi:hypothetical protein